MNFDSDYIFYGIFAFVALSFLFKMVKHGGLKAAMFGADIRNTVGEVSGTGSKLVNLKLKVHELDDPTKEKAIGLELVAKTFASYQMTPITLSASEAKNLIELLNRATYGK